MKDQIKELALKNYSVEIIKDSISVAGNRITTMKLVYPRFIHAQMMAHRVFSRNASSSRAVPFNTMIRNIIDNTAIPLTWGKNQAGMQASDSSVEIEKAYKLWIEARDEAICKAKKIHDLGLHKQHVNRLLEPFMLIEVLVTATEWNNFFDLRCDDDAQPEIQHIARLMQEALFESKPVLRSYHIPFVDDSLITNDDYCDMLYAMKLSTARCARVSYFLRDGTQDNEKDLELHDRLVGSEPIHASPTEHQAIAIDNEYNRNFFGWSMYRNLVEKKK